MVKQHGLKDAGRNEVCTFEPALNITADLGATMSLIPNNARIAPAQGLSEAEQIMPLPPTPEVFRLLAFFENATEWHSCLDNGVTDSPEWEEAYASVSWLAEVIMAREGKGYHQILEDIHAGEYARG
jgi:hypothetical protein